MRKGAGIGGRQTGACRTCGCDFLFYPSKSSGQFCSRICWKTHDWPGCSWIGKNGYMYFQKGRGRKMLKHRMVVGALTGEVVHHIDGNKLNNAPSNLEVLGGGQSEHIRLHNPVLARWARRKTDRGIEI